MFLEKHETKAIQLNMFELKDEDTLKIRRILENCNIDNMTPLEALVKLQEIREVGFQKNALKIFNLKCF